MERNPNPLRNLMNNLSSKEKIALGLGLVIIIGFLVCVVLWLSGSQPRDNSDSSDSTSTTDGQNLSVSTEYNEEHEYTLSDYLPYSEYDYKRNIDGDYFVVEYWAVEENTAAEKGIVVSVDSCESEKNTAAAKQYLDSIPMDLSSYDIVYRTNTIDVPCNQRR
ncbi:hypothetical protein IJG12_03995 [Candidatus Saccharibacteria bacterium]|nr:hypothetical protein [Candidatus Saccharibacteria bacterium]MBQ3640864.1 hypothetical protein [bacterium]